MRITFSTFGRVSRVRASMLTCWLTSGWIARPAISGLSTDWVSTKMRAVASYWFGIDMITPVPTSPTPHAVASPAQRCFHIPRM